MHEEPGVGLNLARDGKLSVQVLLEPSTAVVVDKTGKSDLLVNHCAPGRANQKANAAPLGDIDAPFCAHRLLD